MNLAQSMHEVAVGVGGNMILALVVGLIGFGSLCLLASAVMRAIAKENREHPVCMCGAISLKDGRQLQGRVIHEKDRCYPVRECIW